MDCPNCRNVIPDTAQFCAYCGATVTPAAAAPPPATASAPGGSSRKLLYIGGGGLAALVILVVAAFLVMGGDSEPSTASAPPPPVAPASTPVPPPATAAPVERATEAPALSQATATPAIAATASPSIAQDTIAFADPDWSSAKIQNRIAQYVVEHGYGYDTSAVPGGTAGLLQSLSEGEIQVSMEVWLPLQDTAWTQAQAAGRVEYVGVSLDKDWQSTFVIPAYMQEEYPGLDHVDDLKDPRYRELFATAATDGKARLFGCALGWQCKEANDAQIDGYDLAGHLQVVSVDSEQALFDELYRAYAKGDPWLGYMWGTANPAVLLDLVALEETPYSDECWFTNKACGFKETTILIAVHAGLPSSAPEVYEFLTQWNFTTEDYRETLQWMEDNRASVEQAATYWLEENGDSWRPWVTGEAWEGVQSALTAGVGARGWPSQ